MIIASAEELMHQASMTAHEYLFAAVRNIDAVLGEGYAREHPELIVAMIQISNMDFAVGITLKNMDEWVDKITLTILNYPEE